METSLDRALEIISGCSLADGWLNLAERHLTAVYAKPILKPFDRPSMIYFTKAWSGWGDNSAVQRSLMRGVVILDKDGGRRGGVGFAQESSARRLGV